MSSQPLTAPMGACCVSTPYKHDGDALGDWVDISGMPTYVAGETSNPTKIIYYIPDVFSTTLKNHQLRMDWFADRGFLVLGPDVFHGDSAANHMEKGFESVLAWVRSVEPTVNKEFPEFVKNAQAKYDSALKAKYFAVGFCFGAPYVMDLAAQDPSVPGNISAGAFAHPSQLTEAHFENLKAPLHLSCPEIDPLFKLEQRRKAEDIILANPAKPKYHISVYSGVEHGFSARGDLSNPDIKWAIEHSGQSIIAWFDRFAQ